MSETSSTCEVADNRRVYRLNEHASGWLGEWVAEGGGGGGELLNIS